jgi:hypothetical protein
VKFKLGGSRLNIRALAVSVLSKCPLRVKSGCVELLRDVSFVP